MNPRLTWNKSLRTLSSKVSRSPIASASGTKHPPSRSLLHWVPATHPLRYFWKHSRSWGPGTSTTLRNSNALRSPTPCHQRALASGPQCRPQNPPRIKLLLCSKRSPLDKLYCLCPSPQLNTLLAVVHADRTDNGLPSRSPASPVLISPALGSPAFGPGSKLPAGKKLCAATLSGMWIRTRFPKAIEEASITNNPAKKGVRSSIRRVAVPHELA
jgi:hypothetical protein